MPTRATEKRAHIRVHNLPGPTAAQPIPVDLMALFGRRVWQRRTALKLTQDAVVKQLNHLSGGQWGRTSVSTWENGHSPPDFITIAYLAKVLRTRPEYLAYGIRPAAKPALAAGETQEPIPLVPGLTIAPAPAPRRTGLVAAPVPRRTGRSGVGPLVYARRVVVSSSLGANT